jgi:predicted AAA+ superfamily ATPase
MTKISRQSTDYIENWYHRSARKPMVIRGARQVGKTTSVKVAAENLNVPLYTVNLERHTSLEKAFADFDINTLLFNVSLICGKTVTPTSKGILFFDEAQATPSAYACLRYFYEDCPDLAVILTGSLLDQSMSKHNQAAPVGRVEHYFMGPLCFGEFLSATAQPHLIQAINMLTIDNFHLIPDELHQTLLRDVQRYTITGGMPHAVQLAIDNNFEHSTIHQYQTELIQTYQDDFSKYQGNLDTIKLNQYFNGLLGQVGQQFSHKQANVLTDNSSGDNRALNQAIEQFSQARLFYRVVHSNAETIPLGAASKIRISKFLFVDIGLLLAAQGLPAQSIIGKPLELTHNGILAEQFVGQHLLYMQPPYKNPELYYWQPPKNQAQAEIDFVLQHQNGIFPVEVKSGTSGRLRSLHSFVVKKQSKIAVRIHSGKAGIEHLKSNVGNGQESFILLNLPFYLIDKLPEFLSALMNDS